MSNGPASSVALENLTPHPVVIYPDGVADRARADQAIASWASSGAMARLVERVGPARSLATDQGVVPVSVVSYADEVEGLPEPREGTAYIVSRVTAAAVARADLYFPLDEVRDGQGRIIGCRALGRFAHAREQEGNDAH